METKKIIIDFLNFNNIDLSSFKEDKHLIIKFKFII